MWDADQDLDALLDEYYRLFYGPAADVMQAAFEFGEQNYDRTGRRGGLDLPRNVRFVEQVQAALALTGDAVYATRIRRLLDELPALDELRAELQAEQNAGNPRDEAPVVDESVHLLEVFHPRHFARLAFDTPDAGAQP